MDENALLELCTNLVVFDDALKAGELCAVVVAQGDHLLALTTDRDRLYSDRIEQVVGFLLRKGIKSETLTMPDWRAGDIAPSAREQIQIRVGLRKDS